MVDTGDLKSPGPYRLCGFESHFLYFTQKPRPDSLVTARLYHILIPAKHLALQEYCSVINGF